MVKKASGLNVVDFVGGEVRFAGFVTFGLGVVKKANGLNVVSLSGFVRGRRVVVKKARGSIDVDSVTDTNTGAIVVEEEPSTVSVEVSVVA